MDELPFPQAATLEPCNPATPKLLSVPIGNSDLMLTSKNDVFLQSEGVKKTKKMRSYFVYGP